MKAERIVLIAALIAGVSYVFADRFDTTTAAMIAWKGAGVGLLALWCAIQARSTDGWLIAAIMAAGATGDVLLEVAGLQIGAAAFAFGHILAISLYVRYRRSELSSSQKALALTVAVVTPLLVWLLSGQPGVTIWWGRYAELFYGMLLGLMAATAWISRFPRYRVGLGAMLFVASDLLIFARLGPLAASAWAGFLIWPLYFAGQALIATGVARKLNSSLT